MNADAIFINQIKRYGLYEKIWQACVVLIPVKTVGVMGDGRTYDYVCSLRAVNSIDGMTHLFYAKEFANKQMIDVTVLDFSRLGYKQMLVAKKSYLSNQMGFFYPMDLAILQQ